MTTWLRRGRSSATESRESFQIPSSQIKTPSLPVDTTKFLKSSIKLAWEPSGSLLVVYPNHTIAFHKGRRADSYLDENSRAYQRRRSDAMSHDMEEEGEDEDEDEEDDNEYDQEHDYSINDDEEVALRDTDSPFTGGRESITFNDTDSRFSHTSATDGGITPRPGDNGKSPGKEVVSQLVSQRLKEQEVVSKLPNRLRGTSIHNDDHDIKRILKSDISMVMRRRAIMGYNMDASHNTKILPKSEQSLIELWDWVNLAVSLAEDQKSLEKGPYNFSFRGVQAIWHGFPSVIKTSDHGRSILTSTSTTTSSSNSSSSTSRTIPTTPVIFASKENVQDTAYSKAIHEWVQKGGYDDIFVVSSAKEDRRKAALASCGFGFPRSQLDKVISQLEKENKYPKAAGWALFHGNTERAIHALQNSGNERLKIMSTALAGYLNTRGNPEQNSVIWQDLCRSLSIDLSEPYLRAIFAYIASGDWTEVLDEPALPLRDQLCIALRFYNDEQLTSFLNDKISRAISRGDLEGILLTGLLSPSCSQLLENYVNKTGDVQTAAILMSFAPAINTTSAIQMTKYNEMWIQDYRDLLDQWSLFHIRSKLDISRGKLQRNLYSINSIISPMNLNTTTPKVIVTCTFCKKFISHTQIGGTQSGIKQRVINCPNCQKPLPRCSICLLHMGTPSDGIKETTMNKTHEPHPLDSLDWWFTFCQTCRHGGHAGHLSLWFSNHLTCPVSGCDCHCAAIR